MYLGEYEIDEYLDLVATTHRFSSGAAYDATSITYRVYENGSTTEIITDTAMTKFDSETGFYYNRIQLTAAAGFEVGKSYVVLIKATVDSVAAIDWRSFRIKFPAVDVKRVNGNALGTAASGQIPADVRYMGGSALSTSAAQVGVNVVQVAGTSQTARDLGAQLDASVSSRAPAATALSNATWTDTKAGYLDAAISSRAAESGGNLASVKAKTDQLTFTAANKVDATIQAAGDFAQGAADKIWSSSSRTLTALGSSLVAEVWNALTSGMTTSGSIGKLLVDDIDATISSRAAAATALSNATWTDTKAAYLDAAISSRAPESGGNLAAVKAKTDQLTFTTANKVDATIQAAADFAQGAADKIWSSSSRTLTALGSSLVAEVWNALTSGMTTTGSIGKLLKDDIDATISSRAAASTALSNSTWTDTRAAYLDAAISSRAPAATALDNTVWTNTKASYLDAAISTRAAESGGNLAAVKAKTDQLAFTTANKVDATIQAAADLAQGAADKIWSSSSRTLTALGSDLVAEIWDALTSGMTTPGSIGKLLAESNSGDPWMAEIPGSYPSGTAGYVLGQLGGIRIKKGVALDNFHVLMTDQEYHLPKTGLSVYAHYVKDGGSLATCTNQVYEIGGGLYRLSLTASETDGNVVTVRFTAEGADTKFVTFITQP